MMLANTMLLSFIGEMLSFGASYIHRLIILFIGTDDQHVLSYNSPDNNKGLLPGAAFFCYMYFLIVRMFWPSVYS